MALGASSATWAPTSIGVIALRLRSVRKGKELTQVFAVRAGQRADHWHQDLQEDLLVRFVRDRGCWIEASPDYSHVIGGSTQAQHRAGAHAGQAGDWQVIPTDAVRWTTSRAEKKGTSGGSTAKFLVLVLNTTIDGLHISQEIGLLPCEHVTME